METWIDLVRGRVHTCVLMVTQHCSLLIKRHIWLRNSSTTPIHRKKSIYILSHIIWSSSPSSRELAASLALDLNWIDLREGLRLKCHRAAAGGDLCIRHRCVLKAWCDIISSTNRIGNQVVTLGLLAGAALRLLCQNGRRHEWLLRLLLIVELLLPVDFVDVVGFGDEAIVFLIVLQDHTP